MIEGYKVKVLVAKFGYNTLVKECNKHGWLIPMAHQLGDFVPPYQDVWVATPAVKVSDRKTHGYVFRYDTGSLLLNNKNNLENAIVLIRET